MLTTQSRLGRPIVNFGSSVNKWIFGASVLIRLSGRILFITILAMIGVQIWNNLAGQSVSIGTAFVWVAQNRLYQLFLFLALIINVRHIVLRLIEPEAG